MSPRFIIAHARRRASPPGEALLDALLRHNPDPLAAIDSQLCLLAFNDAYGELVQRLFGVTLEPGQSLYEALREHPNVLAWMEEQWRQTVDGACRTVQRTLTDGRIYEIRFAPLPGYGLSQHMRDVTDRRLAERELLRLNTELETRVQERTLNLEWTSQRLREKEERLSAALDAAQTGTFRWDIDADRMDCDENLQRLLGFEVRQSPRQLADLLDRVHPDERMAIAAAVERSRDTGADLDEVFRLDTGRAAARWLHAKGRCHRDRHGHPIYITGAGVDISELMQAEHELEQREASFRQLADCLPAIVWIRAPRAGLIFANRRWCEYTGLTVEATRNRGWEATVHPDDLPWVRERVRAVHTAGATLEAEYRVRRHDGAYRWHLCRAVPVRDGSGQIRHWFGTAIDIDEQVQIRAHLEAARADAERASRELETSLIQLEAVIENLSDGLVILDAEGNRTALNSAARRLHGMSEQETSWLPLSAVLQRYMASDLHGQPLPMEAWPVKRVLAGERFSNYEIQLRRLDDGEPWLASYSGAPIYDEHGRLMFAILSFRDITPQKDAERRLRNAVETRDRFLSIASHELRTPLTTLSLQLQIARRRVQPERDLAPSPTELAKMLDMGNRQVHRLTRLVDDLLDVSRIEAGRLEFHYESVSLGQLAQEVAQQFEAALREVGCELSLRIDEEVEGFWDPGRLEQVVGNLLTNCIKYAPRCEVHVSVGRADDYALLQVRDFGPGVPAEEQERIFQRFERSRSSCGTGVTGLGLGLFLVRQIIEAHGGRIDLVSAPGEGCAFLVKLPLRTAAPAACGHG